MADWIGFRLKMFRNSEGKTAFGLAGEIARQCSSDNINVSLDFCHYLVDLKVLQLSEDVSLKAHDSTLTEKLIKMCVIDLKSDSFTIKTLKLQLFWRKKYQPRDEIKKIHHERVFKNILPIMAEITEDSPIQTDKDHIYKKIVLFIIMFAGLGSPSQQSIIKETQAALQSIFKTTEIDNFINLSKSTKEQQLVEFARLITGIMLFNKDCKKGGEGMDDLPLILTQGVRATKERFISFKDQLDQKIDKLVKLLLQCCTKQDLQKAENNQEPLEHENAVILSSGFQKEKLEELKALLIHFRQIEFCLNDLIKDLEKSLVAVQELVERLQSALLQIHNVVRYRVAVATVQVFPLFLQLSNVWVEMQEEVDILSEINNIFVDLSLAANSSLTMSLELPPLKETPAFPDVGEIQPSSDFYPGIKVCSISQVSSRECLQYQGFCAWTLAHAEGLLITGNITLGVLQFSNRFYSFSSVEAALSWALDPNKSIKTVLRVARAKPELIKFLNLENDLLEKLTVEDDRKPTLANVAIQTDIHPVESYLSREYTFSEWEMKRRALKLATLTRCATKSQQTAKHSCFRTEMGVQVTPLKNISTQTTRDKSCNHIAVPKSVLTVRTDLSEFIESGFKQNLTGATKK